MPLAAECDVNDRLGDDSWLDASKIEVQVATCEVTLTGRRSHERRPCCFRRPPDGEFDPYF